MDNIFILSSFAYFSGNSKVLTNQLLHLQSNYDFSLLLDSGAFTVANDPSVKDRINLDCYCQFLSATKIKIWRYFTFDVIGSHAKTLDNYRIMLSRGLSPIPIITTDSPFSIVDEYRKTSDVVALGGLVPMSTRRKFFYLKKWWPCLKGMKVHLLGVSSSPLLRSFTPYSCDSFSWLLGNKYKQGYLYQGNGQFFQITKTDFQKKSLAYYHKVLPVYHDDLVLLSNEECWLGYTPKSAWFRLLSKSAYLYGQDLFKKLGVRYFLVESGGPILAYHLRLVKGLAECQNTTL